jgi:hypothetical protein
MACKESKADQKQKQIRQENPFMGEMREETWEPGAFVEARTRELLERDGAEADEGGGKRMAMKNSDASKCRAEKQKIDQNG